ncbi:hypothetical protein J2T10_000769 [Paenarthrobacter nicotinovorans]|uniref:Uncharacterized protein n=1 Tax=Paenarthrobacter nicotinovorans TaxID=29320 RepID=A0ABT9THM9_PAENI|nr:hypothetical protein [Paenarthrobacter nicotinovorans]MDQ0101150.1 hypothetical protein [Paenarthrobacter nicotinovorans]
MRKTPVPFKFTESDGEVEFVTQRPGWANETAVGNFVQEDGTISCFHSHVLANYPVSPLEVWIEREDKLKADGTVEVGPLRLHIGNDLDGEAVDVETIQKAASAMLAAAHVVERLNASGE